MRIIIPDGVVSKAVRKGISPSQAASVTLAIDEPTNVYPLGDTGRIRYDGHGVTVIGTLDRTGKFLTVSDIRVDRPSKA